MPIMNSDCAAVNPLPIKKSSLVWILPMLSSSGEGWADEAASCDSSASASSREAHPLVVDDKGRQRLHNKRARHQGKPSTVLWSRRTIYCIGCRVGEGEQFVTSKSARKQLQDTGCMKALTDLSQCEAPKFVHPSL